jgi:hypothetical protein
MNRAERRAAASRNKSYRQGIEHLSKAPMELLLLDARSIRDPTLPRPLLNAMIAWAARVERGARPLCLTCNHEWTDIHCPAPDGIAVLHPALPDAGQDVAMISGICPQCWAKQDRLERATDVYRKIWPDLRANTIGEQSAAKH